MRPRTRCWRSRRRSRSGRSTSRPTCTRATTASRWSRTTRRSTRVAGRDIAGRPAHDGRAPADRPRARPGIRLARGGARRLPRLALQHRRQGGRRGRARPSPPSPDARAAGRVLADELLRPSATPRRSTVARCGHVGRQRGRAAVPARRVARVAAGGCSRRCAAHAPCRCPSVSASCGWSPRASSRRRIGSGVEVHVWTVNEPADMARLLDLGVDGIVTDRVDLALTLFSARS